MYRLQVLSWTIHSESALHELLDLIREATVLIGSRLFVRSSSTSRLLKLDVELQNLWVEIYMRMVKQRAADVARLRASTGWGCGGIFLSMPDYDFSSLLSLSVPLLIIRIPCIFNVLKANQLFPFPFFLSFTHFLVSYRAPSNFRTRHEWKLVSDSSGVSLLASMFIANVATRTGVIRMRAHSERQ